MVVAGPTLQSALVAANLGPVSTFAGAAAGPFTVHFWAPMSKWLISGASMMELDRPVEKISLAQYTALTLTGAFFSRYALLVNPINYMLCSVNVALFRRARGTSGARSRRTTSTSRFALPSLNMLVYLFRGGVLSVAGTSTRFLSYSEEVVVLVLVVVVLAGLGDPK